MFKTIAIGIVSFSVTFSVAAPHLAPDYYAHITRDRPVSAKVEAPKSPKRSDNISDRALLVAHSKCTPLKNISRAHFSCCFAKELVKAHSAANTGRVDWYITQVRQFCAY